MSIEQLKELFGNQEAILELVQLEGGELALRNAGSESAPLVTIQFNEELKALLGDQTTVVAQQMVQAALYGLLEKQVGEWQAEVVDENSAFFCIQCLFLSGWVLDDVQFEFDLKYDCSYFSPFPLLQNKLHQFDRGESLQLLLYFLHTPKPESQD